MARETSPYEGTFDHRLNGRTCLGRVVSVDINSKRCRVKTTGLRGSTDDLDLPNVQWISNASHPEGDEDTTYPRVGQLGVVTFINSEPYISGWFSPIQASGNDPRPTKEPLREGDKVTSTIGGNRIILRSGGSVEIESTKLCRTYWLPSRNLIASTCQDWELETDGGTMTWDRDRDTDETTFEFFAWDTYKNPSVALQVQVGTTDSGAMYDMAVGTLDSDNNLATKLFNATVQKDGTTKIDIGPGKFTATITPDGKTVITVAADVDLTVQGDVNATVAGKLVAKVSGDADVDAATINLNKDKGPGGPEAGITTSNSHQNVIDLITLVPILPSPTVFADV